MGFGEVLSDMGSSLYPFSLLDGELVLRSISARAYFVPDPKVNQKSGSPGPKRMIWIEFLNKYRFGQIGWHFS